MGQRGRVGNSSNCVLPKYAYHCSCQVVDKTTVVVVPLASILFRVSLKTVGGNNNGHCALAYSKHIFLVSPQAFHHRYSHLYNPMENSTTVQTLCDNSHKRTVKGWASKVVNRSFLVADDFSGYSRSTLTDLCREIDEEIAFINKCMQSTKHKSGMYKVILATENKYQKELKRIRERRTFLVTVKQWAISALIKEKEKASSSVQSPENVTTEPVTTRDWIKGLIAKQKSSQSFVKVEQRQCSNWTNSLHAQSKTPSTDAFNARVKEVLKSLIVEELGPRYYSFCEKAIDTAASEARCYFDRFPDSKSKGRWIDAFDAHVDHLYSELVKKY